MDNIKLIQVFIEFWGAVLCAVFALALVLIRKEEPKSSGYISVILWNIVALLCCDALAIYYRGGQSMVAWYSTRICNFLVFFLSTIISLFAVLLLTEVIRDHMIPVSNRWYIIVGVFALASIALLVISQWNGMLYYIDEKNLYQRGDLYFLSQVLPYCIVFIYCILLICYRKCLSTSEELALWFYVLLPFMTAVFQTFHYGLSLTNMALAVSAIVMILQRITAKSFLRREARIRIEQQLHHREAVDPNIDERMKRATIGKGDVKHIFIVNPNAGNFYKVEQLRTIISKLPEQDYFVFTTRGPGDETELIQQIQHYLNGYKLRIYCCGGSGTIRNVMNGIDDLSKVAIGFYPCGMTNDFMKIFGEDREKFDHIENLIEGDCVPVDYIRTNHGVQWPLSR